MAGDFVYSDPALGKVYRHVSGTSTQIGPDLGVTETVNGNDYGKRRLQSRVCYWAGDLYCLQGGAVYKYTIGSPGSWAAVTVNGDAFNGNFPREGCAGCMVPMTIEGVNYLTGLWFTQNSGGQTYQIDFFKITTAGVLTNTDVTAAFGGTTNTIFDEIMPSSTPIGVWNQYILYVGGVSTNTGVTPYLRARNTVDGTQTTLQISTGVKYTINATYTGAQHWQNRLVFTRPQGGASGSDATKGIHLYSFDGTFHDHGQIADANTDMAWAADGALGNGYYYMTNTNMFVDPATGDLIMIYPKNTGAATGNSTANRHYSVGCVKFTGTLAGNTIGSGITMTDIQSTVFAGINDYDAYAYTSESTGTSGTTNGAPRYLGDYHWTNFTDNYTSPGSPATYIIEHRATDYNNTECRVLLWNGSGSAVTYQSGFTGDQIAPPASINRRWEGTPFFDATRESIEIISQANAGASYPGQITITFKIWGPAAADKVVSFYMHGDDNSVYDPSNAKLATLVGGSSSAGTVTGNTITGLTCSTGGNQYTVRWNAQTDSIGVYETFTLMPKIT